MSQFWDRREKPYILFVFLLPFIWMCGSLLTGRYFPDPGKILINHSGTWACVFLVLVLSITPLVKIFSLRWLSRYRRFFGLAAFFYALFHLVVYLLLFAGLSWSWIFSDLIEKPYIYVGVIAFCVLFILAFTSTKKMIKRLGKNWKKLHSLVYLAAVCVLTHLWWQVKSDISLALWVSAFLSPLLLWRFCQSATFKKHFKKT